jgi:hypothetical protein
MAKWLRIIFVSSVFLNMAFVVGAICARSYLRTQSFELAATIAEAEASFTRYILAELESGEPDRIEAIKERLEQGIGQAEETAETWRNAATW